MTTGTGPAVGTDDLSVSTDVPPSVVPDLRSPVRTGDDPSVRWDDRSDVDPDLDPVPGVDLAADARLISTLCSLRELGRFEEAAVLVRVADAETPADAMSAPAHAAAGAALAAVSDYATAAVHLLLASTDPTLAPAALGRLAELAWIERDHARGRAYALAGLALDPSQPECRIQLHRNTRPTDPESDADLDVASDPGAEPDPRPDLRARPDVTTRPVVNAGPWSNTGPWSDAAVRSDGPARPRSDRRGGPRLAQVAFFADPQGNAGDRVLTDAVRRCFIGRPYPAGPTDLAARAVPPLATHATSGGEADRTPSHPERATPDRATLDRATSARVIPLRPTSTTTEPDTGPPSVQWYGVHAHQVFDDRRLAEINALDGLIVGGGGLFLPDTAPNGNSGWQWNIPDDVLARIDVPLVVFALGYTLFEGQTFERAATGSRFARSLRTLVEHAAFVGLRNHGSVDRVRELLPDHLAERIGWQPCPTTFTDLLPGAGADAHPDRPGRALRSAAAAGETGDVLLNCAYDRAGRRFGDGYGAFLAALRDWVVDTREVAEVRYTAHCIGDERFVSDLRREHGLTLPVIPMYDLDPARIHDHYRRARLVVGMRGHAGMIPFGCGTPIISLISHPEPSYFLADIDRPEWGLSVRDPHLAGRLSELTGDLLASGPAVAADINRIRRRLAAVTVENLRSLPPPFDPARRLGQDETSE